MEWLNISTSIELVRVQTDDIVFVQADENYSDVYLFNGKPHKMTFKLKFFEDAFLQLQNNFFIRVGKSLIVNKKYIYVINISTQELLLSGSRLSVEFFQSLKRCSERIERSNIIGGDARAGKECHYYRS